MVSPSMTSTTTTTSTATTTGTGDVDLSVSAGYDDEQIRLMEEVCIVIDENDQPLRPGTKKECTSPILIPVFSSWSTHSLRLSMLSNIFVPSLDLLHFLNRN